LKSDGEFNIFGWFPYFGGIAVENAKLHLSRRNFLCKGLAGTAGAFALAHLGLAGASCKSSEEEKKAALVHRILGKTGLRIPVVSLGSLDATSETLVRKALEAGITHIATAQYYARGRVEQFVGKIVKDYNRDDLILATGVNPLPHISPSGFFPENINISRFERDFEKSLTNLDVDFVDIFYLPQVAKKESVMCEPLMRSMEKIKQAGKARFLGIGTHYLVPEAVRAAADSGFYDVVMPAYNYQAADIEKRARAVAYAAKKGLGIVAMKTVTSESSFARNTQLAVANPKAALKWVLQNENIHTAVLGITTFDQLETDLSVMEDLTLTPEETKYLELSRLNRKDGLFCQGCGTCLRQCPSAPDIPTLMRCYMYAYGHRDLAAAARNLESVKDHPIACADCSSCVIECPMGFDVRERALDIIRLRDFPPEFFA
jgi:predicted aldo/keto reductase-like oxidoreductase